MALRDHGSNRKLIFSLKPEGLISEVRGLNSTRI